MLEMRIVIRELLRAYEVRAAEPAHERPRRRNITITARAGVARRARRPRGARPGGGMSRGRGCPPRRRFVAPAPRCSDGSRTSTGVAVVFVAVGFLLAVFFDPEQRDQLAEDAVPVIAVARAGRCSPRSRGSSTGERRVALAWLYEGREPTDEEHRRTLGIPTYAALVTVTGWTIGGRGRRRVQPRRLARRGGARHGARSGSAARPLRRSPS